MSANKTDYGRFGVVCKSTRKGRRLYRLFRGLMVESLTWAGIVFSLLVVGVICIGEKVHKTFNDYWIGDDDGDEEGLK